MFWKGSSAFPKPRGGQGGPCCASNWCRVQEPDWPTTPFFYADRKHTNCWRSDLRGPHGSTSLTSNKTNTLLLLLLLLRLHLPQGFHHPATPECQYLTRPSMTGPTVSGGDGDVLLGSSKRQNQLFSLGVQCVCGESQDPPGRIGSSRGGSSHPCDLSQSEQSSKSTY